MHETAGRLERARLGDRAALDDLLARHRGRLLAFLRSYMEPRLARAVDPEDVAQEALLQASRSLDRFEDRGPGSFYRWIVGIAKFKVSERGRAERAKKRAAVGPLDGEPVADDTSPPDRAVRAEGGERLRRALASIPGDQAEAVRMRYLEGCTVEETAERMSRTEAAVKALVCRALDGLADRLNGGG